MAIPFLIDTQPGREKMEFAMKEVITEICSRDANKASAASINMQQARKKTNDYGLKMHYRDIISDFDEIYREAFNFSLEILR